MLVLRPHLTGRCLDYGCGRGFDADFLGIESYDPNWRPIKPTGLFDTITCNYVLNVVTYEELCDIISDVQSMLVDGGKAFFTVRRDIKKDYSVKDYTQRVVTLPFNIFYQKPSHFIIYEVHKED